MITYSEKKYEDLMYLQYLEALSVLGLGDKIDEVTYILQNLDDYHDTDFELLQDEVINIASKKNPEFGGASVEYTSEDGAILVDTNPLGGGYYHMEFCIIKGIAGTSASHESFVTKDELESLIKIFKLKKDNEDA